MPAAVCRALARRRRASAAISLFLFFRDHSFAAEKTAPTALPRFDDLALKRSSGFTLLELLIVVGIIAVLLVLIAPAFTTIKGGGDVTSAAYTIKGTLDTARTYATANNTYTWIGFAGSVARTRSKISSQAKSKSRLSPPRMAQTYGAPTAPFRRTSLLRSEK